MTRRGLRDRYDGDPIVPRIYVRENWRLAAIRVPRNSSGNR